jgi:LacI family transcriptional regulator
MNPAPKKRSYTMRDVARLADVSIATVSAVVNGKQVVRPVVAARVQDAMKALNFHPDHVARSLRVKKTTTLGVIVPDFSSGFFVRRASWNRRCGAQCRIFRASVQF